MAVSTAVTAMGSYSQYQAQSELAKQNAKAANQAYNMEVTQQTYNYNRQAAAASDQQQQNATEAMRAVGRVATSGGEGGVQGLSLDALIGDLYRQESQLNSGLVTNLKDAQHGTDMGMQGSYANYQSRVNSVPKGNFANVIFDTAAAGVSSYASYKMPKIPTVSGLDVNRGSAQDLALANQW